MGLTGSLRFLVRFGTFRLDSSEFQFAFDSSNPVYALREEDRFMPWPVRMTLILAPAILLAHLYVWLRTAGALADLGAAPARPVRLAAWAATILLNLLPLVLLVGYKTGLGDRLFLNAHGRHWLDYVLTFPYWWGFLVVLELLPYFLTLDIVGGGLRLAGVTLSLPAGASGLAAFPWLRVLAGAKVALAVFFMLYVAVVAWRDTNRVRLDRIAVTVPGLPAELHGLRLVLLGDIQVDRETGPDKIERMRGRVAEAKGDLLFFAGDLVTDGPDFVDEGLESLCRLTAPLGRLACMGDHDYWSAPGPIADGLDHCGWIFLDNRHHVITVERSLTTGDRPAGGVDRGAPPRVGPTSGEVRTRTILVTGVRYIYSDRPTPEGLDQLLAAAPPADLKILLVHQPARMVVEAATRHGYHLLLAGHTHGGQFVFHPFGVTLSPTQLENRYYSGYYPNGSLQVVVTNGVGLTLAPLRYGAPAEVTLVTLE
jgi:predicted MPP superfamily phosphohydrolase